MAEQNTLNIHKIERVDESFYFDKKATYDLIFKFNGNKFQAVSYNRDREKFVLQAEFQHIDGFKQYKEVLFQTDFLEYEFNKVYYISSSKTHALVPAPFSDVNSDELLLEFQNESEEITKILKSDIQLLNAKMVFAQDVQELALVRSKFPEVNVLHSSACLFKYIQHLSFSGHAMFLNFNEDNFELILMQNRNCILYNIYSFETLEDLIYFPLFIAEQFGISKADFHIILLGDIEANDEKHTILKEHFQQIFFAPVDKNFEYTYRIEKDTSIHRFAHLYSALLCE
ncbi:MAG: DUF3822 family protein [bacterium]